MAPKPTKAPSLKKTATLTYFRKIQTIDPAHRIGNTRPPTYLKIEDIILWPYDVTEDTKPIPHTTSVEQLVELQKKGRMIQWLPRTIRYIHGLQTFFKDEQEPGGKEVSPKVLENHTNRDALVMVDGELRIPSYDQVRMNFLWCMNQCENQHPLAQRYNNAKPMYKMLDFGAIDRAKAEKGAQREKAFKLAQDARNSEMLPHAKYLNIPFIIPETSEDREIDSIREDYKDIAYTNPEFFLRTFSDPRVKIAYWVQDLLDKQEILVSNGSAIWNKTKAPITDIPPDKTPVDALSEFAMTSDGETFGKQLNAFKVTGFEED